MPARYNHRLYAELHLHLGGAILPRILYVHLQRHAPDHPLLQTFTTYDLFEAHIRAPRRSLRDFLGLHRLIEPLQSLDAIPDFVRKLVRGAFLFEDLCYIELRYTPFFRTDPQLPRDRRIEQMRKVVEAVADAADDQASYPIVLKQILCMHSTLDESINRATLDLAASMPQHVCGIDLAGPDDLYASRIDELVGLFKRAKDAGLKTTGHLYETPAGCRAELLPYLDRIGHGILIPLKHPELLDDVASRGQCLEVCPTSYLKTGQLPDYVALKPLFDRCRSAGVDVVLCTDNAGLHMVRLPAEFENLLIHEVITVRQMIECQDAAFKHAFAWPFERPARMLD